MNSQTLGEAKSWFSTKASPLSYWGILQRMTVYSCLIEIWMLFISILSTHASTRWQKQAKMAICPQTPWWILNFLLVLMSTYHDKSNCNIKEPSEQTLIEISISNGVYYMPPFHKDDFDTYRWNLGPTCKVGNLLLISDSAPIDNFTSHPLTCCVIDKGIKGLV